MTKDELKTRALEIIHTILGLATNVTKLTLVDQDLTQTKADLLAAFITVKTDISKLIADLETP